MPRAVGRSRLWRDHRQVVEGIVFRYRPGAAWRDAAGQVDSAVRIDSSEVRAHQRSATAKRDAQEDRAALADYSHTRAVDYGLSAAGSCLFHVVAVWPAVARDESQVDGVETNRRRSCCPRTALGRGSSQHRTRVNSGLPRWLSDLTFGGDPGRGGYRAERGGQLSDHRHVFDVLADRGDHAACEQPVLAVVVGLPDVRLKPPPGPT